VPSLKENWTKLANDAFKSFSISKHMNGCMAALATWPYNIISPCEFDICSKGNISFTYLLSRRDR